MLQASVSLSFAQQPERGDAKYVLVSQWQEEPPRCFSPTRASEAGEEAAAEK